MNDVDPSMMGLEFGRFSINEGSRRVLLNMSSIDGYMSTMMGAPRVDILG